VPAGEIPRGDAPLGRGDRRGDGADVSLLSSASLFSRDGERGVARESEPRRPAENHYRFCQFRVYEKSEKCEHTNKSHR
jgi:hypothetical protein